MDTCGTCAVHCALFSSISWLWYAVAVVVAYGVGALWFSLLFSKTWVRVFKVDVPAIPNKSLMVTTMGLQLVVTALFGLAFFVLTKLSFILAIFMLIAFCGWQKGNLKFRYTDWKEYFQAALVEAGYTFVAGIIFILFALL